METAWVHIEGNPEHGRKQRRTRVRRLVMSQYHQKRALPVTTTPDASAGPVAIQPSYQPGSVASPQPSIVQTLPRLRGHVPQARTEWYTDKLINLVGQAWSLDKRPGQNDFLSMYVPMLVDDELTYNAAVCIVATCWATHPGLTDADAKTLRCEGEEYHAAAISLLRARVGPTWRAAQLDRLVVSIGALILAGLFQESPTVQMHLHWLERIIQLRGGLKKLLPRVRTHMTYISLKAATLYQEHPIFPPATPTSSRDELRTFVSSSYSDDISRLGSGFLSESVRMQLSASLLDRIDHVKDSWASLAICEGGRALQGGTDVDLESHCLQVEYDLLTYQVSDKAGNLDSIVRLALLLFVNTRIWELFSSAPMVTILATQLLDALRLLDCDDYGGSSSLFLWISCQGARSSFIHPHFVQRLKTLCIDLDIRTQRAFLQELRDWLYLPNLHGKFTTILWNKVQAAMALDLPPSVDSRTAAGSAG